MSDDTKIQKREQDGLVAHGTEWEAMKEQARMMIRSKMVPRALDTPEKVITVMLAGRELGIPPMQALRSVHVIDAKPTLSAETMMALAYQRVPGLVCQVTMEKDSVGNINGCVVTGNRPGSQPTTIAFRKADAQAAGLLTRDTWRKYGPAMYRARAISAWVRVVAPDAILGCYTPEEVESIRPEIKPVATAEVATLEGEVIEAEAAPEPDQYPGADAPWEGEPGANDGPTPAPLVISDAQRRRLFAIAKENSVPETIIKAIVAKHGFDSTSAIARDKYEDIIEEVKTWKR